MIRPQFFLGGNDYHFGQEWYSQPYSVVKHFLFSFLLVHFPWWKSANQLVWAGFPGTNTKVSYRFILLGSLLEFPTLRCRLGFGLAVR